MYTRTLSTSGITVFWHNRGTNVPILFSLLARTYVVQSACLHVGAAASCSLLMHVSRIDRLSGDQPYTGLPANLLSAVNEAETGCLVAIAQQ